MKKKESIQGKEITKEEAYKGLGDPSTWEEQKKEVMADFKKKPTKKNKRLMEDMDRFPTCPECDGTGKIWKGRHWYTVGWQVDCTYCDGLGKLTWKD